MWNKYSKNIILVILVFYFATSCAADSRFGPGRKIISRDTTSSDFYIGQKLYGKSSYYAEKFHGRKTANGEIFDMNGLTAAHNQLPFGTIVAVTNLYNNKTVHVRINDRGPFKKGRILDLSFGAAQKIGMIEAGTADVEIVIIKFSSS